MREGDHNTLLQRLWFCKLIISVLLVGLGIIFVGVISEGVGKTYVYNFPAINIGLLAYVVLFYGFSHYTERLKNISETLSSVIHELEYSKAKIRNRKKKIKEIIWYRKIIQLDIPLYLANSSFLFALVTGLVNSEILSFLSFLFGVTTVFYLNIVLLLIFSSKWFYSF